MTFWDTGGVVTKSHRVSGLKKTRMYLLPPDLEPGSLRLRSWQAGSPLRPLNSAYRWSPSSCLSLQLCTGTLVYFSSHKDTSHVGLRLTLMTSSYLPRLYFQISFIHGHWGLELCYIFWREYNKTCSNRKCSGMRKVCFLLQGYECPPILPAVI